MKPGRAFFLGGVASAKLGRDNICSLVAVSKKKVFKPENHNYSSQNWNNFFHKNLLVIYVSDFGNNFEFSVTINATDWKWFLQPFFSPFKNISGQGKCNWGQTKILGLGGEIALPDPSSRPWLRAWPISVCTPPPAPGYVPDLYLFVGFAFTHFVNKRQNNIALLRPKTWPTCSVDLCPNMATSLQNKLLNWLFETI